MAKSKMIFNGVGMLPDLPPVTASEGRLTDTQIAYITDHIRLLVRTLNGGLRLGDGTNSSQAGNLSGQIKEVTFTNANTDYEVPHALQRVPIGILYLDSNSDGAVIRGSSQGSWNADRLFVRCNVAGATVRFVVV